MSDSLHPAEAAYMAAIRAGTDWYSAADKAVAERLKLAGRLPLMMFAPPAAWNQITPTHGVGYSATGAAGALSTMWVSPGHAAKRVTPPSWAYGKETTAPN